MLAPAYAAGGVTAFLAASHRASEGRPAGAAVAARAVATSAGARAGDEGLGGAARRWAPPASGLVSTQGAAAFAACLCGFVASLATARGADGRRGKSARRRRQCRAAAAPLTVEALEAGEANPAALVVREKADLDRVQDTVEQFVPKLAALQSQAEVLRSSGELRSLIDPKVLRKTELRGVFGEVDQLLAALIDSIHNLRDLTVTGGEPGPEFEPAQVERGGGIVGQIAQDSTVNTMMEVHVVGLSHHNAPVEVREKLAVQQKVWNRYAKELVDFSRTSQGYVIPEVALLSTCNRFELYFASPEPKKLAAIECVHAFLRQKSGLSLEELEPYLFTHSGEEATQHLFEVSSGLDSLVLGEAQILAQVKACHERAIEKVEGHSASDESVAGSGGKIVAKMLQAGIRMGKIVRTRTKIGQGSVSVSSTAVELMMAKAMPDLHKYATNLKVCIVGAGKMSRLLLIALFSKYPGIKVTLVNRSVDKARELLDDKLVKARGGANAEVAPMEEMWNTIRKSDVVFTATGSKDQIISASDLRELGSDEARRLMLVDIAVPRNVATDCGEVAGVASYSVDDLKQVIQANAEKRQAEVTKARAFIAEEVKKFKLWQASQGAAPYLASLQNMAERIRIQETEKMLHKVRRLHEKERQAVDKLTRHIIDHIFEPIYYSMKDDEAMEAKKSKLWALKSIFRLEPVIKRGLLAQGPQARGQLNP